MRITQIIELIISEFNQRYSARMKTEERFQLLYDIASKYKYNKSSQISKLLLIINN